jgi:regulatory protein YycI of two-component signal transduction system YycFG
MQCTIAVSALEALYQQQSMKKKDMVDKIYNIFHGCEQTRTASFADMAFQGQSQFKVLYDFGEIRPNAANNEDRSSGVQLSLKSSLTRQPNRNFVTDTDIKLSHILQATLSSPTLITGRTLSYAADMALKNTHVGEKLKPWKRNLNRSKQSLTHFQAARNSAWIHLLLEC